MENKQENMLEIMNDIALMTLMTTCFGSFLFLVHLSGQPEGFYLSHHLSCHLDFMFFSPLLVLCLANLSEHCDRRKLEFRGD